MSMTINGLRVIPVIGPSGDLRVVEENGDVVATVSQATVLSGNVRRSKVVGINIPYTYTPSGGQPINGSVTVNLTAVFPNARNLSTGEREVQDTKLDTAASILLALVSGMGAESGFALTEVNRRVRAGLPILSDGDVLVFPPA